MSAALRSLVESGTKLWLDSIDPDLVRASYAAGATGATSNPIIVSDIIKTGRFDADLIRLAQTGQDPETIAWSLTDQLVSGAEAVFRPIFDRTAGDDGYVSFELDPLLEDEAASGNFTVAEKSRRYVLLGRKWAANHPNRLIKVPATPGGLGALEELAAAGVNLNVTLIFSQRQYEAAREAVWRGAQRRRSLAQFKSVYSIFVSRLDVYAASHVPQLSAEAQGQVGILNAKRIWRLNHEFWAKHPTPLKQEMIFASTGTKSPLDKPWKYVEAFAGSDIETNPPATNEATAQSGLSFKRRIDELPNETLVRSIDAAVDWARLEDVLMSEGLKKFADPHKALLQLIQAKI